MRNVLKVMKNDYTIIFLMVDLILTIVACKKEQTLSIIGKWQQTKVRVYQVDYKGLILDDTTYSGQTFTNQDFVQFNSDGTCLIATSHYYYPAGQGFPKTPDVYQDTIKWNFTGTWPKYGIEDTIDLGGPSPTDTATASSPNNLVLHNVYPMYRFAGPKTIFDAYYTR